VDPLTLALLSNIGIPIAGGVISRIFGGRPRVPDFVQPALQAAEEALRRTEDFGERQLQRTEGELAAQGVTGFSGGTAAREAIARRVGDVFASVRASSLDAITRARQQQELAETQFANQQVAQTRGAIQRVASGAGQVGNFFLQQSLLNPDDSILTPGQQGSIQGGIVPPPGPQLPPFQPLSEAALMQQQQISSLISQGGANLLEFDERGIPGFSVTPTNPLNRDLGGQQTIFDGIGQQQSGALTPELLFQILNR